MKEKENGASEAFQIRDINNNSALHAANNRRRVCVNHHSRGADVLCQSVTGQHCCSHTVTMIPGLSLHSFTRAKCGKRCVRYRSCNFKQEKQEDWRILNPLCCNPTTITPDVGLSDHHPTFLMTSVNPNGGKACVAVALKASESQQTRLEMLILHWEAD